jgi:hypothetical protein
VEEGQGVQEGSLEAGLEGRVVRGGGWGEEGVLSEAVQSGPQGQEDCTVALLGQAKALVHREEQALVGRTG